MAIVREFTVEHLDDYRTGARLYMSEKGDEGYFSDSDDENVPMEAYLHVEFELKDDRYHIFHLILDIGQHEVRLLKTFDTEKDAEDYSKQQYFLVTGDYPFIVDGMNSAYKSTGDRLKVDVKYKKDIKPTDDNTYEYIIIMSKTMVNAHSLDGSAEW